MSIWNWINVCFINCVSFLFLGQLFHQFHIDDYKEQERVWEGVVKKLNDKIRAVKMGNTICELENVNRKL
jgi:hypothetical protein